MSGSPTPATLRKVPLSLRYREPVFLLLYLCGFLVPWQRSDAHTTLWLATSTWVARRGWMAVSNATTAVTLAALGCLALGTVLRVSSTAGFAVMNARASKLSRHRALLSLGGWLVAVGTSILMPPSGAALFLLIHGLFSVFLIFAEARLVSAGADSPDRVPSQELIGLPRLQPLARWGNAVLAETFPLAFTACFAILAWRYNTGILIQCLLICYGASLVMRAFSYRSR